MNLTKLQNHLPVIIFNQLQEVSDNYGIDTPERMANFLGQCDHESAGFTHLVENLNYSAQGLIETFPKYFTQELADTYARKPEDIANRVYANRMGNGNEASGDGWLYRGKGCIQITGKQNHQAFFKSIGLDVNSDPALISTQYPLVSAAWFWSWKGLNAQADSVDDETITAITKVINGGTNGLADRIAKVNKWHQLLS